MTKKDKKALAKLRRSENRTNRKYNEEITRKWVMLQSWADSDDPTPEIPLPEPKKLPSKLPILGRILNSIKFA